MANWDQKRLLSNPVIWFKSDFTSSYVVASRLDCYLNTDFFIFASNYIAIKPHNMFITITSI